MSDILLFQRTRRDWDTPRNGDFARYVERLTGGQAVVTLDEPGRVPGFAEQVARRTALPAESLTATSGRSKTDPPDGKIENDQKTLGARQASLAPLASFVQLGVQRKNVLSDAGKMSATAIPHTSTRAINARDSRQSSDVENFDDAVTLEGFAHMFRQGLRTARWGFLVLTLVQIGFLMVMGWGWSVGVALSLIAWWLVGAVLKMIDRSPDGVRSGEVALAHVQGGLNRLARQNTTGHARNED